MGAIEQTFHGFHVKFDVDDLYEMSEAEIVKKLRAAGGAHQPTGYDFGHGDAGEGAEEVAPEKAATINPADVAPMHAKAPKPHEEGAMRKVAYMTPQATAVSAEPAAGAGTAEPLAAAMATMEVSSKPATSAKGRSVYLLVTSMPSTSVIEGNQGTVRTMFTKLTTCVSEIDGKFNPWLSRFFVGQFPFRQVM